MKPKTIAVWILFLTANIGSVWAGQYSFSGYGTGWGWKWFGSVDKSRMYAANFSADESSPSGEVSADFRFINTGNVPVTGAPFSSQKAEIISRDGKTYEMSWYSEKVELKDGRIFEIPGKVTSEKVEDVVDNVTIDGNSQPIIGKRQATSFINVQDGEMIVLGGLQRTNINANRTKLGFIWEIPGLSQLLGGRTNTKTRTELLLFIRPHVLPPSQGTAEAEKEINRQSNRDDIKAYLKATDPNAPMLPEKPAQTPAPTAATKATPSPSPRRSR